MRAIKTAVTHGLQPGDSWEDEVEDDWEAQAEAVEEKEKKEQEEDEEEVEEVVDDTKGTQSMLSAAV